MNNNIRRYIIIAGGELTDWEQSFVSRNDIVIGVDYGLKWAIDHHIHPHFAIGDFDSVPDNYIDSLQNHCIDIKMLNKDKDETDTEAALNWAIEQSPAEIVILGAMGGRFDHALANVHLLRKALKSGIPCSLVSRNNSIVLINRNTIVEKGEYQYMSLLPLTVIVEGVTLVGFKYPLHEATLEIGETIGVSNEWIERVGQIQFRTGELLVIRSKD